jgi:hypothetical protein
MEPALEDVRSVLGQVAATLPVECVWVHADVILEPDLVVARLVSGMRRTMIRRPAEVVWL